MKIVIHEQHSNEPIFPAFYKDKVGDLWYWASPYSCASFVDGIIHSNDDYNEVNFRDFDSEWGFVRVHGTITITV